MTPLLVLLLLQVAQEDPLRGAVDKGVTLPGDDEVRTWTAKGDHYKRVLGILLDRDNWSKALAAVRDRTGLYDGELDVKVTFATLEEPAMGDGRGGRGAIQLDVERLAKYEKEIMAYERLKDRVAVLIPPARTPLIVHHELTHCFQNLKQPLWLLEGTASFVARDGHFVAFFRHEKVKVEAVDATYERRHLYARGWAFLEHLKDKHGDDKLKRFLALTMKDGRPAGEAAAEVTGLSWDDLKKQERDWSAKWISSYKIQK